MTNIVKQRPESFEEHAALFCSLVPRVLINCEPKTDNGGDCWTFTVDDLLITRDESFGHYVLQREVTNYGGRDEPPSSDLVELKVALHFLEAIEHLVLTHCKGSLDSALEYLYIETDRPA